MKRKLLISGVTLGACVLAVSVIMSGAPSVTVSQAPTQVDSNVVAPSDAALSRALEQKHNSTTNRILVTFTRSPKDPRRAAIDAVAPAAARLIDAEVSSAEVRYSGSVTVTLNKSVSQSTATKIATEAAQTPGVDYAEPSLTFYPADVASGSAGSGSWNRLAVHATDSTGTDTGTGVVVGIIDTGIAPNPDLPKALLVNAHNGVVWNRSISGTTWPNMVVTASWDNQTTATTAGSDGNWAFNFDTNAADSDEEAAQKPQDGDTVTLSVTDGTASTTRVKVTVDAVVTLVVNASNGTSISGTTDANAAVAVTRSDDGTSICTATADAAGDFACTPSSELSNDDELTVTATDAVGNMATETVKIDTIPPKPPIIDPSNGTVIHLLKVETGIKPAVWDSKTDGTTIPGSWHGGPAEGEWTFTPSMNLSEDSSAWIRLTDAAGNTSSTQVAIDTTAPEAPSIEPSDGTVIRVSGVEAHISPQAFDAAVDGSEVVGVWADDGSGKWTFTPEARLTEQTPTWVRLTDGAGNTTSTPVVIDATAPDAPIVNATDGASVSGTAEPDTMITIAYRDSDDGIHTATSQADENGTWTISLDPRAGDRTTLTATATDAVGNTSDPSAAVKVHYGPPSAPSVAPSDGTTVVVNGVLSGDTATLVDADGTSLGDCVDEGDQSWTCLPDPALTESDLAFVVVTDDTGQTSEPQPVNIDNTSPTVTITSATVDSASGETNEPLSLATVAYVDENGDSLTAEAMVTDLTWRADLVDAAIGSTITVTATDVAGNSSETTAEVAGADDASVAPTSGADSSSTVQPESATDPDTVTAVNDQQPASLQTSSTEGTVLPGYSFYEDAVGHDATDPGEDSTRFYHGTHVAGIVGAAGASQVTGIAPGVKILPIRVLGGKDSGGSMEDVADAISWGAGVDYYDKSGNIKTPSAPINPYPADVLNLSLGAPYPTCPNYLQKAITAAVAKGTIVVAAAGNSNTSIANQSPANCTGVVVVTASTANNTRASYSNWGTPPPSGTTADYQLIAAPGGGAPGHCDLGGDCSGYVVSTTGLIKDVNGQVYNSYVWPMAGTSQAAPHVSAVAAIMLAKNSLLQPTDVANILRSTATPFSDRCPTGACGSGIVDAAAALAATPSEANTNSGTVSEAKPPAAKFPTASVQLRQPHSTLRVGDILTASGSVSYGTGTYQWQRNGSNIEGATSTRYTVTPDDLGRRLSVTFAGISTARATSTSAGFTQRGYISSVAKPKILGTRKVGKRLRATKGSWSVPTTVYRYKWYRNGKTIKGATSRKYKLTWRDRRKRITVRVYVKSTGYYNKSLLSGKTARIR